MSEFDLSFLNAGPEFWIALEQEDGSREILRRAINAVFSCQGIDREKVFKLLKDLEFSLQESNPLNQCTLYYFEYKHQRFSDLGVKALYFCGRHSHEGYDVSFRLSLWFFPRARQPFDEPDYDKFIFHKLVDLLQKKLGAEVLKCEWAASEAELKEETDFWQAKGIAFDKL